MVAGLFQQGGLGAGPGLFQQADQHALQHRTGRDQLAAEQLRVKADGSARCAPVQRYAQRLVVGRAG
ncbi:hypothetical protein FQZ97_1101670 [compost metagenome]